MLSALLAAHSASNNAVPFPLLDLPPELIEKVVKCLGPEDQQAKKNARSACTHLRSAVNSHVTSVKVPSTMEGKSLPKTLLPQLKSISLDVTNGCSMGLWTAANLDRLGLDGAPPECKIDVQADAAIIHLGLLHRILTDSGLMPRVRSLSQQCWGVHGSGSPFGGDVQVSARLKLLKPELGEHMICKTLEHDNLTSLSFAPLDKPFWNPQLVHDINLHASKTLRTLVIQFKPFQEMDLEPLSKLNLPMLEHLELRAQNDQGFGPSQLQPLASAKLPSLKSLVVEVTGARSPSIPHLGEFIRPLIACTQLESVDIWANKIDSFAGLWGVGLGGVYLPRLHSLALRVSPCSLHLPRAIFAANPSDKIIDAFAGLTLDKLALHDIGLPAAASASGIKRLQLTNPRWEDLHTAMSPHFSPDLKVIRVCGAGARAIRTKMLESLTESPALESPKWRMGSPSQESNMQKVRSFLVLHDLERKSL